MTTDITLNGVGYMLLPGSYKADSVVISTLVAGTPGTEPDLSESRRRGREVAGRLAERGAVDGGVGGLLPGVGPCWPMPFPIGGQGIGPAVAPFELGGTILSASGRVGLATQGFGFLASSTTLYRWTATTISARKTSMGAAPVGLATRGERDIFVAFGGAQDVARWEDASQTWTTSVFGAGEQASLITMLTDRPVVVKPADLTTVHVWTSTFSSDPSYTLDAEILAMVPTHSGILIATARTWYLLEDVFGAPFEVVPASQPAGNASAVSLSVHRGGIYAAVDGALYRQSPEGTRFTGGWEHIETPGEVDHTQSFGGWLLVRLTNHFGTSGIWGYLGAGAPGAWFFLDAQSDQLFPGPAGLAGAGNDSDTHFHIYDDSDPDDAANFASSYAAATAFQGRSQSSQTGGGIERDKDWTRLGAEFHRTDGVTTGTWSAQLQYSVNGGISWTNAGSAQNVTDDQQRITAQLSGVTARTLLARVNLTLTSGDAPVLAALWADWEVSEADGGGEGTPGTGGSTTQEVARRWRFTLPAQDGLIDRDGAALGLTAAQIRSNLWARLNQAGSFTDVDGTLHTTVTLTGIEEEWPSPADAALHVSTRLKLTLVEGDRSV